LNKSEYLLTVFDTYLKLLRIKFLDFGNCEKYICQLVYHYKEPKDHVVMIMIVIVLTILVDSSWSLQLSPGGILDEETIGRNLSNLGRSADGSQQVFLHVTIAVSDHHMVTSVG
jgi:hypothetical protein